MAKVQKIIKCPKCGRELATEDLCVCGFLFSPTVKTEYKKPDYIYFQKFNTSEAPENWFKHCPHDVQAAAMSDAFFTLKYLFMTKPPKGDHVQQIITTAKNIGKLALALETYILTGGYIELSEPTKSKTSEEAPFEAE